ncbi:MAG: 4Fe-4S dicluster domain-containing protein [Gemmatimonadota bacterium]|nr:MAG: 4Fe-4S dicluster domain-containing protein [Gemmatimonadota bacterium]
MNGLSEIWSVSAASAVPEAYSIPHRAVIVPLSEGTLLAGTISSISVAIGIVLLLLLVYGAIQSHREGESRAATVFWLLAVSLPLPYILGALLEFDNATAFSTILLVLSVVAVAVLAWPLRSSAKLVDDTPTSRIDERDIMFARKLLEVGTERFEQYYRENPQNLEPDDRFRAEPGLLKKGSSSYSPFSFSAANASFAAVRRLHELIDGAVASEQIAAEPRAMTAFVKKWAQKLGARAVGVTHLQDYHKYTTVGRGDDYGSQVQLDHSFAIAVTVEMDKNMIDRAPFGPVVMESAQQYLVSGTIAVQLAECIRALGYAARAHIDGNYRVVCPLVARDAGLGEIGRMGLLMTPDLGPRVRIAVVTTDLPLVADERYPERSMIDFCVECKKCAEACPGDAIPSGDRETIDGVKRWQIDQEECYILWSKIGTDCGRCVKVCPYSHPDNLLHSLVRRGVRNSALFRKLAIKLDDVFYGRIPPPLDLPQWMKLEPKDQHMVDDTEKAV